MMSLSLFFTQRINPWSVAKVSLAAGIGLSLSALTACQKPANPNPQGEVSASAKSSASEPASANAATVVPTVYATTNVWGAVAKQVGGEQVKVVVGVDELSQDPHDYQATANDKLNISKAALVLVNGGGYDDWGTSLAKSVENKPIIINAVQISGLQPTTAKDTDEHDSHHEHDEHPGAHAHTHTHTHGDFNEHVFYSIDTAKKVAEAVNYQLALAAPANKAIYAQNTQQFMQDMDRLKAKAKLVTQQKSMTAFATEPVTGYLLADMGIQDITPKPYVTQSETDAGVSVKVLNDSKAMLSNHQVGVLIVNAQTEDSTSKQLIAAAKAANVAVVPVYETFPQGIDSYSKFIEKTIDDFAILTR